MADFKIAKEEFRSSILEPAKGINGEDTGEDTVAKRELMEQMI